MKMSVAVRLLRLLNARPEGALTASQIRNKWLEATGKEMDLRTFQRYMSELSVDGRDGPALVDAIHEEKAPRYYLRLSQVAIWFMTEEAALETLLTQRLMGRMFDALGSPETKKRLHMAEILADESSRTRRLRDRLRIVADGIGRRPAEIDKKVLAVAISAIAAGHQLVFSYVSAAGKASAKTVNPLGLVAKDGSIYLVASEGLSGKPRNYPLQRVKEASASQHRLEEPLGFNLDRYIEETHQLSHVLNPAESPLKLKLRVSPDAIYHFRERPLANDQVIGTVVDSGDWHVVTATVPDTILLVPFLVSMGPWIEVLEPAAVRARTFQWLRDTCAMYQSQG